MKYLYCRFWLMDEENEVLAERFGPPVAIGPSTTEYNGHPMSWFPQPNEQLLNSFVSQLEHRKTCNATCNILNSLRP